MRKALILGAGGTGARVITNIADLIDARRKENINSLDYLKYYEMDTATSQSNDFIPASEHNYALLTVSKQQDEIFKRQHVEGKHSWADAHIVEPILDGAKAIRMVGKYGFLCHYDKIFREVNLRLERLHSYEPENKDLKMSIYIVANTASGTGSGCFLDLGMMVQNIIRENSFLSSNPSLKVTLIITIPDDRAEPRYLRNSYFALQELNHFMMGNPYEIDHISGTKKLSFNERGERNNRPFDFVYIIGPRVDMGIQSFNALENLISEYIYNDIYSPSAEVRDGKRVDLQLFINQTDKIGQRPLYKSFGLSTIEYPSSKILEAASYKYILGSLEKWIKEPNQNDVSRSVFEGEYFDSIIYKEMQSKCVKLGVELDYDKKLKNTKDKAEQDLKNNDFDPVYLERLIKDFINGFNDTTTIKTSQYIQSGDIRGIIETNNANLIKTLTSRVKIDVLEKLFSGKPGSIEIAKKSIDSIINKIQSFQSVKTDESFGVYERKLTDDCNDIINVKNDPLLPNILKFVPIRKLLKNYFKNFDRYADIKIKNEIADKLSYSSSTLIEKDKLLPILEESLKVFKSNIEAFENQMKNWKLRAQTKFEDSVKTPTINGHIVNKNEIQKLSEKVLSEANIPPTYLITKFLKDKYFRVDGAEEYGELMDEKKKSFGFPNNDIFMKVKDLHRNYIENKDVVEAFLEEQRIAVNHQADDGDESLSFAYAKVDEVYAASKWFADVRERDEAFEIEDEKLKKIEFVFYPDGHEVTTQNEATNGNNKFAKILFDRNIIATGDDWSWKSQSSNSTNSDKNIILFLKETGLFPIRFIQLLYNDKMQHAIDFSQMSEDKVNTFKSRMDYKNFITLTPPVGEKQHEAKELLVKSISAGIISVKSGGKFTINSKGKTLPNERKNFSIPIDYNAAVAALYDNNATRGILQDVFEEFYLVIKAASEDDDTAMIEFVTELHDFKENPGIFGLVVSNEDDLKQIEDLIEKYVLNEDVIHAEWRKLYEDEVPVPDHYGVNVKCIDEPIKEFDEDGKVKNNYRITGFYCVNNLVGDKLCNQFLCSLGNEISIPEKCPKCGAKLKK